MTSHHGSERDVEISQEILRIRRDHPYQGNYREQMAALLGVMFFKYGERIGANRLAALLAENGRSPSTSTAQDEINKFWHKVRENSAIRLNRPDVPPFLLDLFSTMVGTVWENSMAQAESMFVAHRQELAAQITVVQKETDDVKGQLALARAGAEHALSQLQAASVSREALVRELAKESANRLAAEQGLVSLTEQLGAEKSARVEESGRMHTALADLKKGLDSAADEQRRLMTIGDEFKQQAARDRALRIKAETTQIRTQAENEQMQAEVTRLSRERGILEGVTIAQGRQIDTLASHLAQAVSLNPAKSRNARMKKIIRR